MKLLRQVCCVVPRGPSAASESLQRDRHEFLRSWQAAHADHRKSHMFIVASLSVFRMFGISGSPKPCAVLCCAVLCCAVLCCAVLCCAVLCCAVLCCAVLCSAVLYCAVLCCAVLCCAVLCCAVLCCGVLNSVLSAKFHRLVTVCVPDSGETNAKACGRHLQCHSNAVVPDNSTTLLAAPPPPCAHW